MSKQNVPNIADLVLRIVKVSGGAFTPEAEARFRSNIDATVAHYFSLAEQTAVAPAQETPASELKLIPQVEFMPRTNTYALGVDALKKACEKEKNIFHPQYTKADGRQIYRPLTLRENCAAMVWDYETLEKPDGSLRTREERLRLFTPSWKDSCTSVVTNAGTTKFKVVPQSAGLITIAREFESTFLPVDYSSVQATELDSASGLYNQLLPEGKVPEVEGWRQGVEEDVYLLKTLAHIVCTERKCDSAMGFWVRPNTFQDEERALFIDNLSSNCNADGNDFLYNLGSFLRVAQVEVPHKDMN